MTAALPVESRTPDADPSLLVDELLYVIERGIVEHPRSQQTRIGPSEIGTPCDRRLAMKLAGIPEQPREPGWLPTIGTAVHSWLAQLFTEDGFDDRSGLDEPRWLVEERVTAGRIGADEFDGSCDLYDRVTGTVIDWKIIGKTSADSIRRHGPSQTYRTQGHIYGLGWELRGHPVERVMIVGLPRNELTVRKLVWWSEPYNRAAAERAIARAHGYTVAASVHPDGWGGLIRSLPTADDRCGAYCPFWRFRHDNANPTACGGHPVSKAGAAGKPVSDPFGS